MSVAPSVQQAITCLCNSTCYTKDGNKRKGCPCKTANQNCSENCSCGTKTKPCTNKEGYIPQQKRARTDSSGNIAPENPNSPNSLNQKLSEDEENRLENNQQFLDTLDSDMIKQLALCCLQRGAGSMDFVHSMMIRMYDTDNADGDQVPPEMSGTLPVGSSNISIQEPIPDSCKCGYCYAMPQEVENKCCGHKKCATVTRRFIKLCLDPEFLQLSCRNVGDIRNDREDKHTATSFWTHMVI